jgi:methionyl-tRNA formyltransferase
MDIQVLVDNRSSWIWPYAERLVSQISALNHRAELIHSHKSIVSGDILLLLGCEQILKKEKLSLHKFNLVVHESALPAGRGWSPVSWQILEGKNEIPITLLEAVEHVDAGRIYLQDTLIFEGHELIDEVREKQGTKTIDLFIQFLKNFEKIEPRDQFGLASYYTRRKPKDSELNLDCTLREIFNQLRIVDNEKYPAFFIKDGFRYIIRISKEPTTAQKKQEGLDAKVI